MVLIIHVPLKLKSNEKYLSLEIFLGGNNMNFTNQVPEVLTRKEAATLIRVCLTSFDKMRLPCFRVGRRVFYRKSILDAWISAQEKSKGGNV